MKRRRLKAVPDRTKVKHADIHDRIATELPAGALIAVGVRPDPYDPANRISVALSLRGDPLAALHCRHLIADYQFAAGREWQRYYEMAAIGPLKAQNFMQEPVDCQGSSPRILTDTQRRAVDKLTQCRMYIGESSNRIVTLVLGNNLPIKQAALALGMVIQREQEYVGMRFRDALNELAKVFGYA